MIYPPLDDLLKLTENSRYTLATVAAKRARQIIRDGQTTEDHPDKAVTIALKEVFDGKTKYERTKSGIK